MPLIDLASLAVLFAILAPSVKGQRAKSYNNVHAEIYGVRNNMHMKLTRDISKFNYAIIGLYS